MGSDEGFRETVTASSMDLSAFSVGMTAANAELSISEGEAEEQSRSDDGVLRAPMAIVEANIDDMNPEFYTNVFERLFEAGAVDAFLTPIIMKKGRPANKLTALTPYRHLEKVVETFFKETTSIGLRIINADKRFLPREMVEVTTPWGSVKVKACYLHGELVNFAPEYEDCRRLSKETGVAVKTIYQAALKK